jgi:hypothetical protein
LRDSWGRSNVPVGEPFDPPWVFGRPEQAGLDALLISETQCRLHVVRRPLFVIILMVILAIARLFCPVSATDERPVGMQLV